MDLGRKYIIVGTLILLGSFALFIFGSYLTYKYTESNGDLTHQSLEIEIRSLSTTNRQLIEENQRLIKELKSQMDEIQKELDLLGGK